MGKDVNFLKEKTVDDIMNEDKPKKQLNYTGYTNQKRNKNAKYKGKTHMTFGNTKMSIPLFSLPPLEYCPGRTALCSKYCYGLKPQRRFKNTRNKRARNFELSLTDKFVETIVNEIEGQLIPYVRIHESGDYYNQEYLDKWIMIAKMLPDVKFVSFTKSFHLDFSKAPKNFIVILSIWADTNVSELPDNIRHLRKAYTLMSRKHMKGKYTDPRIYFDNGFKAKQCKGFCDTCMICFNTQNDVYFDIH